MFLDWTDHDRAPDALGRRLESALPVDWRLDMITNRGIKIYPDGLPETFCTDHWRCRITPTNGDAVGFAGVLDVLAAIDRDGLEVIKTEHLYEFDGVPGFSLGQGQ